jgi:hypothetical protein
VYGGSHEPLFLLANTEGKHQGACPTKLFSQRSRGTEISNIVYGQVTSCSYFHWLFSTIASASVFTGRKNVTSLWHDHFQSWLKALIVGFIRCHKKGSAGQLRKECSVGKNHTPWINLNQPESTSNSFLTQQPRSGIGHTIIHIFIFWARRKWLPIHSAACPPCSQCPDVQLEE